VIHWQFWKPRHTVASVAARLAAGLADGSVDLDEPLLEETDEHSLVVELDVPSDWTDAKVLELVSSLSSKADQAYREHGGQGLRVQKIEIDQAQPTTSNRPVAHLRLEAQGSDDNATAKDAALKFLKHQEHVAEAR